MTAAANKTPPCHGCLRRWESKDEWECVKCEARYLWATGALAEPPYPGYARSRPLRPRPKMTQAAIAVRIRRAVLKAAAAETAGEA